MSQLQKLEHAPNLNTILMIERTLQHAEGSTITLAHLKKKLPRQVNHTALKTVLEYLEESNKIAVSMKGLTWIHNNSEKMKQAMKKSYKYPDDFPK